MKILKATFQQFVVNDKQEKHDISIDGYVKYFENIPNNSFDFQIEKKSIKVEELKKGQNIKHKLLLSPYCDMGEEMKIYEIRDYEKVKDKIILYVEKIS